MFGKMARRAAATLLMIALCAGLLPFAAGAEALGEYNEEDLRTEYDEAAATALDLGSDQEDTYTISEDGVYVLTGSYAGQLIVEAGKEEVVRLVFEGVSIASTLGPAVYIQQAEKVVITLAEGTQNALSGGPEDASDEENANAALYSKEDLSINGAGSLRVAAAETHGIASNDDLILAGGAIDIEADRDGIKGRDSVRIYSGEIAIRSGEDGIVSDNDEGADKGYIVVDGGALNITAANDGMQAETALQINGGDIQIASGGGSAGAATASGAGMQARGGFPGQEAVESEQDVESAKGIKAGSAIEINAGTLGVDSKDDAIHSNGSVAILAGTFSISSGDDAIHADGDATVEGGAFDIPTCYEGIEGATVSIRGGEFAITSCDDGVNAAGGADGSGVSGFGGMDEFAANPNYYVVVDGGALTINSQGDCIDSNGDVTVNGGTLNLTCGGNGNTALDANGTFTNNGGSIATNDGSENGTGIMGGRMGMPGGMRR